jgi:hypothetical protein
MKRLCLGAALSLSLAALAGCNDLDNGRPVTRPTDRTPPPARQTDVPPAPRDTDSPDVRSPSATMPGATTPGATTPGANPNTNKTDNDRVKNNVNPR